jgi:phosphate transport system substrate-binding protein
MPLKEDQLKKDGLVQWPMVMGAIVPVVNLQGIKPGELVLDGVTLADIYLGKIRRWDHAQIKKLNPTLALPSTNIAVVRRSDGSGTTFNFTDYLTKVSKDWADKVGADTAVEWPVGVGAKGNDGVAGNVAQTRNSIGYVEYAYAKQNNLIHTALINMAGKTVQPTIATFQAAAANADWANAPGFYQILTNQKGDESWPITAATFILIHAEPANKAAAEEALKFFRWAFEKGDKMAEELDYVPMPDNVVAQITKSWSSIKTK